MYTLGPRPTGTIFSGALTLSVSRVLTTDRTEQQSDWVNNICRAESSRLAEWWVRWLLIELRAPSTAAPDGRAAQRRLRTLRTIWLRSARLPHAEKPPVFINTGKWYLLSTPHSIKIRLRVLLNQQVVPSNDCFNGDSVKIMQIISSKTQSVRM